MAKGPLVTDRVKVLIATVYRQHPKWKARAVRNEVDYILHKDNPKLHAGWPSLSSVNQQLAKVHKNELIPDPQSKPWSTATLGDHPIPPEALPKVLELWKLRLDTTVKLTIREAKWAARLSAVKPPKGMPLEDIHWLNLLANQYAGAEKINEILGHDSFDSEGLDRILVGLPTKISYKRDIECDETGKITKMGKTHTTWEALEGGTRERSHTSKG